MRELFRRLYYLLNRRRLERELHNDMEAHREMMSAENRRDFGNPALLRERISNRQLAQLKARSCRSVPINRASEVEGGAGLQACGKPRQDAGFSHCGSRSSVRLLLLSGRPETRSNCERFKSDLVPQRLKPVSLTSLAQA